MAIRWMEVNAGKRREIHERRQCAGQRTSAASSRFWYHDWGEKKAKTHEIELRLPLFAELFIANTSCRLTVLATPPPVCRLSVLQQNRRPRGFFFPPFGRFHTWRSCAGVRVFNGDKFSPQRPSLSLGDVYSNSNGAALQCERPVLGLNRAHERSLGCDFFLLLLMMEKKEGLSSLGLP